MSTDTERLERIEKRLDKISEAILQMARTDEKVKSLVQTFERITGRIEHLEEMAFELKQAVAENTAMRQNLQKIQWMLFTAAILGGAGMIFFGVNK